MKIIGVIKDIPWEEATKCMSDECKYLASKPHNIKRWEKFRGRQISITGVVKNEGEFSCESKIYKGSLIDPSGIEGPTQQIHFCEHLIDID